MATEKKPKPTAEERKIARQQKAAEERAAAEKLEADFQANKKSIFEKLFARAAKLALLANEEPDLVQNDSYSWWFENFKVNASKETFTIRYATYSLDNLSRSEVEDIEQELDTGFRLTNDLREEKEAARVALEKRRALIKSGMAKLSADEIEALGISHMKHV